MNALPKPDHRTLPRNKRPPSPRDEALYLMRHTKAWTQDKLAKEFGISQSRVSRILRRVETWRGNTQPSGENDAAAQQRVERYLERQRHQELWDRSLRAFDNAPKQLTTIKEGERNGKSFRETTVREVAPSVQFLKVAQRAAEDLAKAADKPAPPPPCDPETDAEQRLPQLKQALVQLRQAAEEAGSVPHSEGQVHPGYCVYYTVEAWLGALLGEPPGWLRPWHVARGTPLAELAQTWSSQHAPRAEASEGEMGGMGEWENERVGDGGIERQSDGAIDASNGSNSHAPPPRSQAPLGNARFEAPHRAPLGEAELRGLAVPSRVWDRETTGTPEPGLVPAKNTAEDDITERRRLHAEKLRQWDIARRRGLPIQFVFDPADGPLPPRYVTLDGTPG